MARIDDVRWAREMAASGAARGIREAAGLSGPEVAAELGVAPSTLSRWERNLRRPRGDAAARWARFLRSLL